MEKSTFSLAFLFYLFYMMLTFIGHIALCIIENYLNIKVNYSISDQKRKGDHIWYISDVSKFKNDFPRWKYMYTIEDILKEMLEN